MRDKVFRFLILIWACVVVSDTRLAFGISTPGPEYHIKALYLYNFAMLVEWPAEALGDANTPITICILGEDPVGPASEQVLRGKKVHGRELAVKRSGGVPALKSCQIVFISSSEKDRLGQILATLSNASVLTVSDLEGFSQSGGMINFTKEGNKIRFEVNTGGAERAGLKINQELLKAGKVVRQ